LADLGNPVFTGMVPDLNRYSQGALGESGQNDAGPLVVISATPPTTSFLFTFGPAFKIHDAPPALLRPLYRRLPRAFSVRDGKVERTYSTVQEIRQALRAPVSARP
jgi:hypothetical protein